MTLRSPPNYFRWVGLAAVLGGAMLVLANVVTLLDLLFPNLLHGSAGPGNFAVATLHGRSTLVVLGELLVGLGLVGLYARQAGAAGAIGLAGFVLAFLGHELVRGNYLAVLFSDLGLALFGVASLRARVYPRAAAVLLIVSALIREVFNPTVDVGPGADFPYIGAGAAVVLSGVVTWMGFVLLTQRGEGEEARTTSPSSTANLLRLGGLAAVVGAVLVVLFDVAQFFELSSPDPGAAPGAFGEAVSAFLYVQQLSSVLGEAVVMLGLVALYVRFSATTPQLRSTEILGLIGFLVAYSGTYFALDIEDVNWGAVLGANLGWALFGVASLRARVYPRTAAVLLVVSALASSLLNPLIVSFVAGEVGGGDPSRVLYQGSGAYPIAYASIIVDIVFYAAIAWLGSALFFETRPQIRRLRHQDEGRTFHRYSSTRFRLLGGVVLVAGLLPILLVTGIFPGGQPPGLDVAQATSTETNSACPPADQATYGAYASDRLVVHNPCQHMIGTLSAAAEGETDGDVDIYVNVDPEYASLTGRPQNVNDVRRFSYGGNLLMELMPRDGQSIDSATGQTRPPHIPVPNAGDKVDVWGAWVFDSAHGYYEIHPVFSMSTSSDGGVTWGNTYTSGPQYGGPPRTTPNATAFTKCRDENGNPCVGYYKP
jgi:hypothetical protein